MISVCMATYNGERFIREQIESILAQLSDSDELVISDDGSTDNTLEIILKYEDNRIRLFNNTNNGGPVGNFETALTQAHGDYIFLADQDDIWLSGRVDNALKILKTGRYDCVICNRIIIDAKGNTDKRPVLTNDFTKYPFWRVLLRNQYIGCCMAITRKLLNFALPFPDKLPMHDLWIGYIAHLTHRSCFLHEPLVAYRRHECNVTSEKSPFSVSYRIKFRLRLINQLIRLFHKK